MEKKITSRDELESNLFEFEYATFVPYLQKEEMAKELVSKTLICDESGAAYASYQRKLMEVFLIAKYYTNIDTDGLEDEKGRAIVFDFMTRGAGIDRLQTMMDDDFFARDINHVLYIAHDISHAVAEKHKAESSLGYKVKKQLDALMGDEDTLTEAAAKSRPVAERLIDLLGLLREKESNPLSPTGDAKAAPLSLFAKK